MKTDKHVNLAIFQGLVPFSSMPVKQVEQLARTTVLEIAQAGEALVAEGELEPHAYYILSGQVSMNVAGEAVNSTLMGGSDHARVPLIHTPTKSLLATATCSVIFFRIPLAVVQPYLPPRGHSPVLPNDTDGEVIKRVGDEMDRALKANKLVVPSLPDVANRVRDAVNDPGVDALAVAKIIQADPPLAARLVQVANSPLYRGSASITNCRIAVSRLGIKVTRDLVMSCSLQQMFTTDHKSLQQELSEQWRQSTLVGAISSILARLVPHLDADRALLAGLLHNIGALPIVAYAANYPSLVANTSLRQKTILQLAPKIGEQILRRWKFDADLITAVSGANDWFRDGGLKADYCDLVQLAQLYSFIDTPHMATHPTLDQVTAYLRVPIGRLGPRMTVKVLEEARADIAELQKVLGSS